MTGTASGAAFAFLQMQFNKLSDVQGKPGTMESIALHLWLNSGLFYAFSLVLMW